MKTNILFCILVTALFISCSPNENELTSNPIKEETFLDLSYGNDSKQKFDLYLPANRTTTTKTLILVHGGGWTSGDKADMNYLIPFIKQNLSGYAIANMNYRLASTGVYAFPMQIDDVNAVFNKLKNDNNNISDDFGFIGTSAGAHLSLLYSYTKNQSNNIKMVASIVGPTNFTDVNYTNNPAWISLYLSLTGVNYIGNEAYYQNLSPYHKATSVSPPTIMFYGNADSLIPTTQGQDLHAKLDQLGVYNEFNLYNGGHGDWAPIDQLDAYTKLANFVKAKF
ncbi:alpha/beta hydrolase [Flavobacterium sp.]|uniref:alpha/beta hydrolase n=1 Tax=Flavobacterium sp. TaxID=239 RepID=UPI00286B7757|nr:alpha/beta hydrolase [Flavobacterium sp.]